MQWFGSFLRCMCVNVSAFAMSQVSSSWRVGWQNVHVFVREGDIVRIRLSAYLPVAAVDAEA